MTLDVFETRSVCVPFQGSPEGFHNVLAVIEAGEPLDDTILVKMKNYLPVRHCLNRFLVVCYQHQWNAIGKVKEASTQYRSV